MIPIAYTVTDEQLAAIGKSGEGVTSMSRQDWLAAGTVEVGDFTELDNADEHPLQFFFTHIEEQSILFPWLLDPEIIRLWAAAHLEGRSLDEAELAGTNWWQTHNADERQWLILNSSDPTTAGRLREVMKYAPATPMRMLVATAEKERVVMMVIAFARQMTRISFGRPRCPSSHPVRRNMITPRIVSTVGV